MKTFKRMALLSLAVLATAFAFANGDSKEPRVKKSRKAKKELVAIKDMKKDSLAKTFDHLALTGNQKAVGMFDKFIIAKGDSIRFKTVFIPGDVVRIVAENGQEASPEDLKKGEWIVTLKPEKSKWCVIKRYHADGYIAPSGGRVVVVAPEEYDEVITKYRQLSGDKRTKYVDKIAGGDYSHFFPTEEFRNSRWK